MKVNIYDKINEIEEKYNVKVIYCIKSGSMLYGTNSETSDVDYTGIFVPSLEDVILKKDLEHYDMTTGENDSKNSVDDVDIKIYSIYRFMNLIKKGETGALDLLFSFTAEHFESINIINLRGYTSVIKHLQKKLVSKNTQAFVGYCLTQARRYNIKGARYTELLMFTQQLKDYIKSLTDIEALSLNSKHSEIRTAIEDIIKTNNFKHIKYVQARGPKRDSNVMCWYLETLGRKHIVDITLNELLNRLSRLFDTFGSRARAAADGIDNKALSHALRVILECKELLETGSIKFPLTYADRVKAIKYGSITNQQELDELLAYLDAQLGDIDLLIENSTLPETVPEEIITQVITNTMYIPDEVIWRIL